MEKNTKRLSSSLTGVERTFHPDEIIVTKTDLKGHIIYANQVFLKLAGYPEKQIIGAPHRIIRHPDMPKCVFKLLWDTIQSGREIFAYVVNRSMNGDHYWVFAHITPSYDLQGKMVGFHSNRRVADPQVVKNTIIPLYAKLCAEESKYSNAQEAARAGLAMLNATLENAGVKYDEFIFSLLRKN
jgi:PAS domain S-box-containing protein